MIVPVLKRVEYDSSRYDVETVDEAINIITTSTEGMTAKQRWEQETPVLMALIEKHISICKLINQGRRVLDYGCGVGRFAKPLIDKFHCEVIGVDSSTNMRALATSMVDSAFFVAVHPAMIDVFDPASFDAAIAVWTLQHCCFLDEDIKYIANAIRKGGRFFIVNNTNRCLPIEGGGWIDDGLDVDQMITTAGFKQIECGQLDESIAPGWMQQGTFWAVYERT